MEVAYETTGRFRQDFRFLVRSILSNAEQRAFERAVESLTPMYARNTDAVATVIGQKSFVVNDPTDEDGKTRKLGRNEVRRNEEQPLVVKKIQMEYIITYKSHTVDVSNFPQLYIQFLTKGENRLIMENTLIDEG
eukprot:CAMPEP_0183324772 /NCGR_PEP_ID=MMETSP0160_2-20130417/77891_1 /TAXON_ID=2839 ORGANISM="Odontella Sinensis, Strain Grunow 1884" /NCGR_SAMPLE_ID=MMETSP0160_2 /ASSEMBLY_ACC=CAM_ASM_000250 /LENGTH=134 /DNA_ID=CAMNT_0025492423 /DNA_START=38 /DNA_END=438 /DNA_ORIENTATION=+